MYKIGPYNPFPSVLRGDPTFGAFCETLEDEGNISRYVIIRPREYLTERTRELISKGHLTLNEAHPEIELMSNPPKEGVNWLYYLEAFKVARDFHSDQDTFAENSTEFKQWCFDDFNEMMEFCGKYFQITVNDFKKDWETNYPQS